MTQPLADTPTTETIWDVVERLLDIIGQAPALADVPIYPGFPGDNRAAQCIWVSEIAADNLTIPVLTGGRLIVDELTEVKLEVEVLNLHDLTETQRRLSEILGAIKSKLQDLPNLGSFPSVVSCLAGSGRRTCGLSTEGHMGVAQLTVLIHTRIQ